MKNSENYSIRIERKGKKNLNVQKRDVSTHFQHQDYGAFSYPKFNVKFRQ